MLQVTMLGRFGFAVDDALIRVDFGQSGRLLACYLFQFPNRTHRRERLVDLFWTDFDAKRGRPALNTAIWRIRKLLSLDGSGRGGAQLITLGNDVVFEPSSSISIDTQALQIATKHVSSVSRGELSAPAVSELKSAVDRYCGPFLDGDEGEWILHEREKLHCLYVRSLIELMKHAVCHGQFENALEYGRRILAVDALRESIQRDLMLLLVLNGQRGEAIFAYQKLKRLLNDELGIEPMPETKRIAEDIISGEIFSGLEQLKQTHFHSSALG